MKKVIVRLIVGTVALATLAAAPVVFAQQPTLRGNWNSQATITDCNGNTLAEFRAMQIYIQDGSLVSVDNQPPTVHGTGLGRWRHLNGVNYSSPFQIFNFNPDGSFAGVQKIRRRIVLAADGNSYTSDVTFERVAPDGSVVASGCGTEVATRLQPFTQASDD